ncbi:unnamed protein product [Cyprideis torosa]|uniref:Uncharacterized protein n=1 Tax=Cyprideis torosa TaxID=163714 RepID=A0A7R8ZJZ4_9CRUS|nr:unnamed protein product [Cyprideis torosa]CAG0883387.1 unnamed protein product [Cyprideis torosa]
MGREGGPGMLPVSLTLPVDKEAEESRLGAVVGGTKVGSMEGGKYEGGKYEGGKYEGGKYQGLKHEGGKYEGCGEYEGGVRQEIKGGAWCPKHSIGPGTYEWLEVLFEAPLRVIRAVETQGRFGNGEGIEYSEEYRLQYWRPGFQEWRTYKDRDQKEIFPGNTNTYDEQKNILDPPIIASRVRFVPFSDHPRTVCLRVELHGCHYEAPQEKGRTPNESTFYLCQRSSPAFPAIPQSHIF